MFQIYNKKKTGYGLGVMDHTKDYAAEPYALSFE